MLTITAILTLTLLLGDDDTATLAGECRLKWYIVIKRSLAFTNDQDTKVSNITEMTIDTE